VIVTNRQFKVIAIMAAAFLALDIVVNAIGYAVHSARQQPAYPEPTADFAHIKGEIITGRNATSDFGKLGDCIYLRGVSNQTPTIEPTACGSAHSNYRIVQIVRGSEQCTKDVDQRYRYTIANEPAAICLDYDWSSSNCLAIGTAKAWHAIAVTCANPPLRPAERPIAVVYNTKDVNQCPDGGFAHAIRGFTVCTLRLG
jgi:hypothetical protein